MVIHECPHCDYKTTVKRSLNRHLAKKFSCKAATYHCSKCAKPFHDQSALYHHQGVCEGPKKSSEEELKEQIEELQQKIDDLSKPVEKYKTIEPVGFGKLEDAIEPQVYFGRPGELLIPEIPIAVDEYIIKFGSTKEPGVRIPRHSKDFGSFKLLDSIVSDNPVEIEDKIREWLKINNKLIRGKTVNKQTTDTELFVVQDQEEYTMIVNIANSFAKLQEKRLKDRIGQQMDLERQRLEYDKQSLMMQMEMMRLNLQAAQS